MRLLAFALVLLLSADVYAQGTAEIDTPTVNGLAHGMSTYKMADGSKTEITWVKGRKHGHYRKVHPSGVVVEEGNYEHGQRAGEWTQRDVEGNKVGSASYLLGVLHGLRERHEYTKGKGVLVESIHYVLGMRHGPALEREPISGQLVNGSYLRDKKHGEFTSRQGEPAYKATYFCGWKEPENGQEVRVPRPSNCDMPETVEVFGQGTSSSPKQTRLLTKTLCAASETLEIPVRLDQMPIWCRDSKALDTTRLALGLWSSAYPVSHIVRAFEQQLETSMLIRVSVDNSQAGNTGMPILGIAEVSGNRAKWRIGRCLFDVDVPGRRVKVANLARAVKATATFSESAVGVFSDLISPKSSILEHYHARMITISGDSFVLSLAPRVKHASVRSAWLHLQFDDNDRLRLEAMTIIPRVGELRKLTIDSLTVERVDGDRPSDQSSSRKSLQGMTATTSSFAVVDSKDMFCGDLLW